MTTQTDILISPEFKMETDLSSRAVSVARIVDRLRPGRYILEITKSDIMAADWKIEVIRADVVQKMSLSNYVPE